MKAILLSLVTGLLLVPFTVSADSNPEFTRGHKFVYFAVLEGLYEEGLSDAMVASILGEGMTDHFVYGCPVCIPAYQAILLYKDRPGFVNRKRPARDFGSGLPALPLSPPRRPRPAPP